MKYSPPVGGQPNDSYIDGNPANGTEGSAVPAAAIEAPQREILAVIEAAGIVPSNGVLTQLLSALRAAGVFQTPTRFDSSTKVATTEFLRQEGLQGSGVISVATTPFAVNNTHAGAILYASTGAGFIDLPDATTWPVGKALVIQAAVATTIRRSGTQLIYCNSAGQSSVVLGDGDSITLFAVPAFNGWVAPGNAGQLGKSAVFGGSLAGSGYQKLPSGLIIQWGSTPVTAASDVSFTFPIAFPNACINIIGCQDYSVGSGSIGYGSFTFTSKTTGLFRGSVAGNTCRYVAFGY